MKPLDEVLATTDPDTPVFTALLTDPTVTAKLAEILPDDWPSPAEAET